MTRFLFLAIGLLLCSGALWAQTDSPVWVSEAIALGQSTKLVRPVRMETGVGRAVQLRIERDLAALTTPFLRVAMAAREAKERYRPFTSSDVTKAMLEPVATVHAPCARWKEGRYVRAIAPAEQVVIIEGDEDSPTGVVHPSRSRLFREPEDWLAVFNSFLNYTDGCPGVVAEFPLTALKSGRRLVVTYVSTGRYNVPAEIKEDMLNKACPSNSCPGVVLGSKK